MPDVAAAERFIARVARLERELTQAVMPIWRQARVALRDVLERGLHTVQPIVADVSREIAGVARTATDAVEPIALLYAQSQVARLEGAVALLGEIGPEPSAPLRAGLPAWQAATVGRFLADGQRMLAAGGHPAEIAAALTTPAAAAGRISAWQWADGALALAVEAALWQATNGTLSSAYRVITSSSRRRYQKQALAAIDGRTTRCCLAVHGQIRELDQPFDLSGSPRFADAMQQPPFHHRCRTVIALYLSEMEQVGIPTTEMRAAARTELARR